MPERGIVGRVYLERGQPVTVLTAWKQIPKAERLNLHGLEALKTATPRNVLIERANGTRVVRPFRGLRKVSPVAPAVPEASPPVLAGTRQPGH